MTGLALAIVAPQAVPTETDDQEPPLRAAIQVFVGSPAGPDKAMQQVGRGYVALGYNPEPMMGGWFTFKYAPLLRGATVWQDGNNWTITVLGWRTRTECAERWPITTRRSTFRKVLNYDGTWPSDGGPHGWHLEQLGGHRLGRMLFVTAAPERYWRPLEQHDGD